MSYCNHLKVNPDTGLVGEGVRFERTRRITSYLVGTLDRFNDAKRAEEHDRVKHMHLGPAPAMNELAPDAYGLHQPAA